MRLFRYFEDFFRECEKYYDEFTKSHKSYEKEENVSDTELSKEGLMIQSLQKAQAEKKEIDAAMQKLKKHSHANIPKFLDLLKRLEDNGYRMGVGYKDRYYSTTRFIAEDFAYKGTHGLEMALSVYTTGDIDEMANELKRILERTELLENYKKRLNELNNEIAGIKQNLGIE